MADSDLTDDRWRDPQVVSALSPADARDLVARARRMPRATSAIGYAIWFNAFDHRDDIPAPRSDEDELFYEYGIDRERLRTGGRARFQDFILGMFSGQRSLLKLVASRRLEAAEVGPWIRDRVEAGDLDRDLVLEAVLQACADGYSTGAQRVLARLLTGLAPTEVECRQHAALITAALPLADKTLVKQLVPLAELAGQNAQRPGPEPEPVPETLVWSDRPPPRDPEAFVPVATEAQALEAWHRATPVMADLTPMEQVLDAHVRGLLPARCEMSQLYAGPHGSARSAVEHYPNPLSSLARARIRRIAERADDLPFLLSTPTSVAGTLSAEVLADRLTRYREEKVTAEAHDLLFAVARLEPEGPTDLGQVTVTEPAGVTHEVLVGERLVQPRLVRHTSDFRAGRGSPWPSVQAVVEVVDLPEAYAPLRPLWAPMVGVWGRIDEDERLVDYEQQHGGHLLFSLPHHTDCVAAGFFRAVQLPMISGVPAHLCGLYAGAPGPVGTELAYACALQKAAKSRTAALGPTLDAWDAGLLDPELCRPDVRALWGEPEAKLTRIAAHLTELAEGGATALVWPAVTELVSRLGEAPRLPPGAADVLELAGRIAAVLPRHERRELPGLAPLADRRGSSKPIQAARALREALTR